MDTEISKKNNNTKPPKPIYIDSFYHCGTLEELKNAYRITKEKFDKHCDKVLDWWENQNVVPRNRYTEHIDKAKAQGHLDLEKKFNDKLLDFLNVYTSIIRNSQ